MNNPFDDDREGRGERVLFFLVLTLMTLAGTAFNLWSPGSAAGAWLFVAELLASEASAYWLFTSLRGYLRRRLPGGAPTRVLDYCAGHYMALTLCAGVAVMLALLGLYLRGGDLPAFFARGRFVLFVTGTLVLVPGVLEKLSTPRCVAVLDASRACGEAGEDMGLDV